MGHARCLNVAGRTCIYLPTFLHPQTRSARNNLSVWFCGLGIFPPHVLHTNQHTTPRFFVRLLSMLHILTTTNSLPTYIGFLASTHNLVLLLLFPCLQMVFLLDSIEKIENNRAHPRLLFSFEFEYIFFFNAITL